LITEAETTGLRRDVDSLRAQLGAGATLDPATRTACDATLERLRGLWRRAPELFDADALRALKEISQALRAGAPSQLPLRARPAASSTPRSEGSSE